MAKKTKATEKPEKKMVTKFRVNIERQHQDYDNQEQARNTLIELLQTGKIYFCRLTKVKVEDC